MAKLNQTWQRRKAATHPCDMGTAGDSHASHTQFGRHGQMLAPLTIPDGLSGKCLAILTQVLTDPV
ncbi:hypothetical protein [Castellaniella sp.]|uniref:hypothetical protein n=1 Tax=Castellaniella sp. TaxID=1955812 RepID=UPI002AFE282A|nr:hypothetical protein [Castellaniella sp.]